MKKIILSASVITAVAAIVVGGTYAVWTASTTIQSNTVSTATVSLDQTGLIEKPIGGSDAQNMLPGQYTNPGRAGIYNEGSVPLKLYMQAANLSDTTSDGICANTLLSLYTGHANGTPSLDGNGKIIDGQDNEAKRHIATKSVLAWATDSAVELTGVPPFATAGANITQIIWQQAQLHPGASGALQGKTCTWDEVFTGETL